LLYLNSGYFVGQGEQHVITPPFVAQVDGTGGVRVKFLPPVGTLNWDVSMGPAPGATLAPGTYESAGRFSAPGRPHLDVSGEGRGCDVVNGRFTVHEVSFDSDGGLVTAVPGLGPSGPLETPVPTDHLPACISTLRPTCNVR